ncbi:MAG: alpha/beta fold hydrolase [Candidatus Hodarchaeota archaeon]
MKKIQRNMISVNGIKLFYLDSKTHGDVMICLHGRWGRAETWVDFMTTYSERYRIIAPDQRGHGLSDKPYSTYTVEEMASDIVELANILDISKCILVGHSMGGHIAAYIAANHPDRVKGLAILDKSPNGPHEKDKRALDEIDIIDPITKDWPLPFSSLTEAREYIRKSMDSELSYQYFMNSLVEDLEGFHMMYSNRAISANIAYYQSWYELLPRIQCMTMIARSNSHEAVNDADFERMKQEIRYNIAFEISDPDHNIHLSKKEEFYGYFNRFLAELT